jgi:hypothetical protein
MIVDQLGLPFFSTHYPCAWTAGYNPGSLVRKAQRTFETHLSVEQYQLPHRILESSMAPYCIHDTGVKYIFILLQ